MPHFDVIIIGAGAAGLSAAALISRNARKTCILEARDRIGGRIHSTYPSDISVALEHGAEFVHGEARTFSDLAKRYGIQSVEITGDRLEWSQMLGLRSSSFYETLAPLLDRVADCREEISFDTFIDRQTDFSDEIKSRARRFIEGYNSAFTDEISARALSDEYADDGNDSYANFKIPAGYSTLLSHLRDDAIRGGATLSCSHIVQTIKWKNGSVTVFGTNKGEQFEYTSNKVLITVPIPIIAQEKLKFDPPLLEKVRAAQNIGFGKVIKIITTFDRTWWHDKSPLQGCQFLYTSDEAIPTWWPLEPKSEPALVGWTGGPAAERLGKKSDSEIRQIVEDQLGRVFSCKNMSEKILDVQIVNWQKEEFSLGSYSYEKAGFPDAKKALSTPVDNTLYFAGEGTVGGGETGTVEAALISGHRAAEEMLR